MTVINLAAGLRCCTLNSGSALSRRVGLPGELRRLGRLHGVSARLKLTTASKLTAAAFQTDCDDAC